MPSGEKGLDRRKLKDVKARDMKEEDLGDTTYKHRVQHGRLVALFGEKWTADFERGLYEWRKEWGTR